MMRRHDWASRMFATFDAHMRREFAFGADDCSLFVARVVDAMTDSTFAQQLADAYQDERGALRMLAKHGSLLSATMSFLGEPSTEPRPLRGDVVLFDGGIDDALGIWDGLHIIAMGEGGLRRVPRSEIKAFWRVA
jgi:uncharacterized protein YfaT (DUF1175 family)